MFAAVRARRFASPYSRQFLLCLTLTIIPMIILTMAQPLSAQGKDKEANAVNARCQSILAEALDSDAFWPAMHAAEGLTLTGHPTLVISRLSGRIDQERDEQRRCGLARELARAGQSERIAVLVTILKDTNSNGRVHAAESLYKLGAIGDASALQTALAQKDNLPLQLMSAAALARAQPQSRSSAMSFIRDQLSSAQQNARYLAAFLLARLGDASDIAPLQQALKQETDGNTQAMMTAALASLGDAAAVDSLRKQLSSPSTVARTIAAEILGNLGCVDCREPLSQLLTDENLDTRVRAATAYLMLSLPSAKGQPQ